MFKIMLSSGAFALALLFPMAARAATDNDLAEIRHQIRELRETYEARIKALELRLKEAEQKAAQSPALAGADPGSLRVRDDTRASAFNPAISAILSGTYANLSQDPATFAIAGFTPGGEIGPGRRGFGLAESEVILSANVDPHFSGSLVLALSPENEVAVEEAYGLYVGAPLGLSPKFGRFLSGLGYLNEQHAHAWDFVDTPLAYQAFLGGQYANDGLQVKWIAPLEHFVELGAEAGNGDGFPGNARSRNGVGSSVVFAHAGGDIGDSHSWRAGLSYLRTRAENREFRQADVFGDEFASGFSGTSRVAVADFVWKYAPHGNARQTSLKVQGEYFRRKEHGELAGEADGIFDSTDISEYSSRQSGWYLQGVYQFMPMWRIGARYDRLDPGTVDYGANGAFLAASTFKPRRSTVMLDYSPSEFSRLRLQFARAQVQPGITDNEWFVQYILSLGAHGGHKY